MSSSADLVTESVADLNKIPENGTPKSFRAMTMSERLSHIKEVITVEPLIAAYLMSSVLCGPALYTLEFEKACRSNLNFSDTVCDAIVNGENHNYTDENNQIQRTISNMHSWQTPIQNVMPLIIVLFLGSYSDRHKLRKPFLLFPIFGEFFAVAGCILCVIFMKQWPLEAQGVAQTVVPSLFGGPTMIIMAVFSYIADVSTLEMRTLRIGIVQIVLSVCQPIVQSFSGVLFEKIGYIPILCIAGGLYLFAVCYGFFFIKEPKTPVVASKTGFIADAFDPKHALETFNVLLKKSAGNNRVFISTVLLLFVIYNIVLSGEGSILYLYLQSVFQWTVVQFSYFLTVSTIIHLIGTSVGISLFTKVMKLHDLTILIIAFLDKIATNIIMGVATTVTMVYVALSVSIITAIASIALRSFATKVVSENDLGKAQSLFGIFEAIGQAIAGPLYNTGIYVNTLETFPSAIFFFGAILLGICICIILWMYFKDKQLSKMSQENGVDVNEKPIVMEDLQITHI